MNGRLLKGPLGFHGTPGDRYIAVGSDCTLVYVVAYVPMQEVRVKEEREKGKPEAFHEEQIPSLCF